MKESIEATAAQSHSKLASVSLGFTYQLSSGTSLKLTHDQGCQIFLGTK
jgi:hypothetical protein